MTSAARSSEERNNSHGIELTVKRFLRIVSVRPPHAALLSAAAQQGEKAWKLNYGSAD